MSNVVDIKTIPELNVFDAWMSISENPTIESAWKEQQITIDEQNTALNTAIGMLQKQKKIIEDLKMFYEKALMDMSNLEIENMQLKNNKGPINRRF